MCNTNPAPQASFSVREHGVRVEASQVNAVQQVQINMAEIWVTTGHIPLQVLAKENQIYKQEEE